MSEETRKQREQLITKVQKLMAMADSTTFAAEAETFRKKAVDLMADFAISERDLRTEDIGEFIWEDLDRPDPEKYELYIANAIARFNGVLCINQSDRFRGTSKIRITGRRGDIIAFHYMHEIIERQMGTALVRLEQEAAAKGRAATPKEYQSYMDGFALGLNDKVSRLMDRVQSTVRERGLVPVDKIQSARNWYTSEVSKLTTARSTSWKSASQEGYKDGLNATLNKGVKAAGNGTLRLT